MPMVKHMKYTEELKNCPITSLFSMNRVYEKHQKDHVAICLLYRAQVYEVGTQYNLELEDMSIVVQLSCSFCTQST